MVGWWNPHPAGLDSYDETSNNLVFQGRKASRRSQTHICTTTLSQAVVTLHLKSPTESL